MKHFVSRVLAIGLTGSLLFTGCASESVSSVGTSANESVSSSSESQHEPVTITLYADSATNGANEAKIEAFQNLYPWITVDLVEMPAGAADRVRTLSTVLQAKDDSMDAFLIDCTWPEMFASAGWLEPLDDVYTSDELTEFSEGALQGCYVDGKLVCLPTFLNTGALLYRADLLEKYGFEPAKTWDELIEQSKVVMAGEPGVYGYAAAWQKAEALTCCTMEHIWGYDGNVLDENGNPTFDTEAVKSGISSMKKILDEGVAIDGILGMMSKDVKAAFFAGQVLYIRDWSAALAAANDPEQSSVAGNVKVAQLPAGTDGNEQYNCNGGWNIGVSAYSSHKEEAKLLVKYWTSDDAMLIGATMSGKMPARPALYENKDLLAADSDMAKLYDLSDNSRIVKALKKGDSTAFEAVYKAYSGLLRTYATNILQDTDAAYEVVQDAFMAIWLNRKSLDDTKSLRNYLLRAVHNNSLRLIKAEEIRRAREEKAMEEQMMDWEEVPVSSQRNELLIPAIERLPEQSRKVLQMSYWEEKKNAVIADELSISIRTVETILYKVKKKLRKEIKKK